jgi:hypothetical protein
MKSYYYHSTLTIGWRIFNHIENSSSPTHDFDECIYHHIMIDTSLSIAVKIITALLSDLKEHGMQEIRYFYF